MIVVVRCRSSRDERREIRISAGNNGTASHRSCCMNINAIPAPQTGFMDLDHDMKIMQKTDPERDRDRDRDFCSHMNWEPVKIWLLNLSKFPTYCEEL